MWVAYWAGWTEEAHRFVNLNLVQQIISGPCEMRYIPIADYRMEQGLFHLLIGK